MKPTISTVTARESLKPRRDAYWVRVSAGNYLGFRRMTPTTGTWLARAKDQSTEKQQYKTLGDFSTIPDHQRHDAAMKAARDWFSHISNGGLNTDATIAEVCERFCLHLEDAGKDASDQRRRFSVYVLNNQKLANTKIQNLSKKHVQDWRRALANMPTISGANRGGKRTDSTLNRDVAPFKAALNLALADGLVTSNAAWLQSLKPIKNASKSRDVYLDLNQRRKLASIAQPDLQALIQAAMLLPVRPGALAALTVGDFDKRRSTLHVGKDKTGSRTISLPPDTVAFFSTQTANKLPSAHLLTRANGSAWNKDAWKTPFKAAAQTAGLINVTMYALRHSAITDLVHDGMDLLTVAQLSGTSLKMIEQHYGHLTAGRGATALKVLTL